MKHKPHWRQWEQKRSCSTMFPQWRSWCSNCRPCIRTGGIKIRPRLTSGRTRGTQGISSWRGLKDRGQQLTGDKNLSKMGNRSRQWDQRKWPRNSGSLQKRIPDRGPYVIRNTNTKGDYPGDPFRGKAIGYRPSIVFVGEVHLTTFLGGLWAAGSDPAGHFGGFPWQRDVRGARRRKVAGFGLWLVLLLLDPSKGSPTSKWVTLGVDLGPSLDGPWSRFR